MSRREITADPRPDVAALLADPAVRRPLKMVLREWSSRDPVDAAVNADLLAQALGRAADEALRGPAEGRFIARENGDAEPLD